MFFPRPNRRTSLTLQVLVSGSLACGLCAAQTPTPTPTPTPATQPATPPPAQPLPSIPASTKSTSNDLPGIPGYRDPLKEPVVVRPGPAPLPSVAPSVPASGTALPALPGYAMDTPVPIHDHLGSTYIPVDSPVYPMALRLYSLGYLDTAFINMRPWTRRSLLHMLQASSAHITEDGNDEAIRLLAKLQDYVSTEPAKPDQRGTVYGVDTLYTRLMGIDGQTLRDSYHLGQTIANDYGRPYQQGFNNLTGFSTINEFGRFSLYVRGEYQHAPAGNGYSFALANQLSLLDQIPYSGTNLNQPTDPQGPIAAQNPFALQEATLAFHFLGHEISAGKSDAWQGPGLGSAMSWSNNAQDIYSFRINRVDPWHIPFVSRFIGPLRYDFFVGSLKGHTDPNAPWVHSEQFSFAPSSNFQFAFERTVIWGGEGHEPITFGTFFHSFFSFNDTESDPAIKHSTQDPGARYSDFSFSWRLPFLRHYVTLYTDSISHDDVSPVSAPRRAAYRPGIYISQFPGLHKLDLRVEGASTDVSTTISNNGTAEYYESVQVQGYTNKGYIMGDWIGRQAKGGQAWLTYHLDGNQWVQLAYLEKKTPNGFIPGGTTQGQFTGSVVKRIHRDIEVNAWLQYERWKAPIYITNPNNAANHDTVIAAQITWYPKLHVLGNINGK
jgi:hypothetical protein